MFTTVQAASGAKPSADDSLVLWSTSSSCRRPRREHGTRSVRSLLGSAEPPNPVAAGTLQAIVSSLASSVAQQAEPIELVIHHVTPEVLAGGGVHL
jgi:hypothetical protein